MIIQGYIKNITFYNPQNGFSVLRIIEADTQKIVIVTGAFPEFNIGEFVKFEGEWGRHPKFGEQFKAIHFELEEVQNTNMVAYLSSGMFPGIGAKTAQTIVNTFGDNLQDVLDFNQDVFRKTKIKGLSATKIEAFLERWNEGGLSRKTLLFLYNHNIIGSIAKKLWTKFGTETIEKIKANPYILCDEIWGIGFLKADEIATKIGINKESPMRLQAAILYSLQEASVSEGHCYLPKDELTAKTMRNLRLDINDDNACQNINTLFEKICKQGRIECSNNDCFFPPLARAEQRIADFIKKRLDETELPTYGFERELVDFERAQKFCFDPIQRDAIRKAIAHRIFIITGGPGTGKTTIIKGIIHLAKKMGDSICLAAPTGRAAKRMGECCGEVAKTLHRLLEVDPITKKFNKNENNRIDCNLLIVDEFSMVDTWLAASLLEAVNNNTRIIFVGDSDQLPSVGPGNVLNDLLQCPRIPNVRLQHIFRQSGDNDIADKAAKINQGLIPSPLEGPNFHFIPFETSDDAKQKITQLITIGVKSKIDIDLKTDMQILVPMRKGSLGIFELNPFLQDLLNPKAARHKMAGVNWSVGDRVMQTKNNYNKNVFNGDIGIIHSIDQNNHKISVFFDDNLISYELDELDELTLAYACTIHKSQGSEYPAVIVVLDTSHYIMLQRNLIYTAITRAKGHVWVLSAPGAFNQAIRNNKSTRRYTKLKERIG